MLCSIAYFFAWGGGQSGYKVSQTKCKITHWLWSRECVWRRHTLWSASCCSGVSGGSPSFEPVPCPFSIFTASPPWKQGNQFNTTSSELHDHDIFQCIVTWLHTGKVWSWFYSNAIHLLLEIIKDVLCRALNRLNPLESGDPRGGPQSSTQTGSRPQDGSLTTHYHAAFTPKAPGTRLYVDFVWRRAVPLLFEWRTLAPAWYGYLKRRAHVGKPGWNRLRWARAAFRFHMPNICKSNTSYLKPFCRIGPVRRALASLA